MNVITSLDVAPSRTHPRSLHRRRFPVWVHIVLAVAILVAAGAAVAVTATSAAAPQSRGVEPFMAGTAIRTPNGRCTAGPVFQDDSALGGITEYRRSVRFILTAGHCGKVGDEITSTFGYSVGEVTWKSPIHDLMLIRVEPRLDRGIAPGCRPGSSNLPCVAISSHYYPRAVGRVFTGGPGVSDNVPVPGTTMSGDAISISGSKGGTVGGHTSTPPPANKAPDPPHAQDLSYTLGPRGTLGEGDSGGPLLSHNGNVFGILKSGWLEKTGGRQVFRGVVYSKVSLFLAEQSGYAPAPPE